MDWMGFGIGTNDDDAVNGIIDHCCRREGEESEDARAPPPAPFNSGLMQPSLFSGEC